MTVGDRPGSRLGLRSRFDLAQNDLKGQNHLFRVPSSVLQLQLHNLVIIKTVNGTCGRSSLHEKEAFLYKVTK